MDIQLIPLESDQLRQPPAEDLGFCQHFANRMFTQRYSKGRGWHDARIEPYAPLQLAPSTAGRPHQSLPTDGEHAPLQ